MAGDPAALALVHALDRLRDDFREDLGATEKRVTEAIDEAVRQFGTYREEHGREHVTMRGDSVKAHERFDAFILAASLAQARKDGVLGVLRFLMDVLGRNWKALAAVAMALLAWTGNIQVDVGLR